MFLDFSETDFILHAPRVCKRCGHRGPMQDFYRYRTSGGEFRFINICCVCRNRDSARSRDRYRARLKLSEPNRERSRRYDRNSGFRRKLKVFSHYGLECSGCGESDIDVLSIDHVNNDGAEHRLTIGKGGSAFYSWLINNGFPSGFQTLCMNCNLSKRINGGVLPEHRKAPIITAHPLSEYANFTSRIP